MGFQNPGGVMKKRLIWIGLVALLAHPIFAIADTPVPAGVPHIQLNAPLPQSPSPFANHPAVSAAAREVPLNRPALPCDAVYNKFKQFKNRPTEGESVGVPISLHNDANHGRCLLYVWPEMEGTDFTSEIGSFEGIEADGGQDHFVFGTFYWGARDHFYLDAFIQKNDADFLASDYFILTKPIGDSPRIYFPEIHYADAVDAPAPTVADLLKNKTDINALSQQLQNAKVRSLPGSLSEKFATAAANGADTQGTIPAPIPEGHGDTATATPTANSDCQLNINAVNHSWNLFYTFMVFAGAAWTKIRSRFKKN